MYVILRNMEVLSLTALRKNLYQVIDHVLATGVPAEIQRKGKKLLIAPLGAKVSKLSRLKKRKGIIGNPQDLVHLELSQWHEPLNLK